jgi:hypothetical protein
MAEGFYEVMFNTCYGGYSLPVSFVEEVFKLYPPETEVGKKLFPPVSEYEHFLIKGETPDPEWNGSYHEIHPETKDLAHGYKYISIINYFKNTTYKEKPKLTQYITKDYKTYYFLTNYCHKFRDCPEVIALGKQHNLFSKKGKKDEKGKRRITDLRLAKVPIGYGYSIREYDGMESVSIKPDVSGVLTELLAYIDSRDEGSLGIMSKMLVKKEKTVRDFLYPKVKYDSDSDDE